MTKISAIVVGIFLVLTSFTPADAGHSDGVEGLLAGGVGGAAIGHVITGTPEGIIAGSFLGGTIGMLVDAGNHHNRLTVRRDRHRHYRPWPGYRGRGNWSHRGRHFYGKHGSGHRRDCRNHRGRWDGRRNHHR
jgi:hypothetical protein